MGVVDTLLGFNGTRRGKVIMWSCVSFGVIMLLAGILLATLSAKTISPAQINIQAANIQYITEPTADGLTGYYVLEATSEKTPITVAREPLSANANVNFTCNNLLVSIDKTVTAGGTAILTVNRVGDTIDGGMFEFTNSNDPLDKIRIDVNCGSRNVVIFVKIVLRADETRIEATLQENLARDGFPDIWEDSKTGTVDIRTFDKYDENYEPDINKRTRYRVALRFYIFGQLIFDTTTRPDDYAQFGEIIHDTGIRLLDETAGYTITIPDGMIGLVDVANGEMTFDFQITWKPDKTDENHFTQTDFALKLVGWMI